MYKLTIVRNCVYAIIYLLLFLTFIYHQTTMTIRFY